ncbi:uncharacterized protein LOC125670240 [Ostrea edulis]|uniref:uncharacterized protein LOC125670240 n=1 Tax=Ostrea edulis TaxID=37623 RepID=UPI0024AF11C6|nr:uncharacterized protein LOC125670240 [Ostrea edulis]
MRLEVFTLVLCLGILSQALVIHDPTKDQSLPTGTRKATLKSHLDQSSLNPIPRSPSASALGFNNGLNIGQISPFSPTNLDPRAGTNGFNQFTGGVPVNTAQGIFPVGPQNPGPPSTSNRARIDAFFGSLPVSTGRGGLPVSPHSPDIPVNSRRHDSRTGRLPAGAQVIFVPVSPHQHDESVPSRRRAPVTPRRFFPDQIDPRHRDVSIGSNGHHHDPHHHDAPVNPPHRDPHHHGVPVNPRHRDPHHHDVPMNPRHRDPHHHDVPVNPRHRDPHHHDVPVNPPHRDPHHHDVPVNPRHRDPHHHDVPVNPRHRDPHHHDVPVNPPHHDPHHHDVPIDDFNIFSPTHKIGDLVPIMRHGHVGVPRSPLPPPHGQECQFRGCSIGQECVIAKTIVTKSETLCPRAYSGRCVCVPGCVHDHKFIPHAFLKYEGKCKYCKCFPDGRVECRKSPACVADRQRDRHIRRKIRKNRKRQRKTISIAGVINRLLGTFLG